MNSKIVLILIFFFSCKSTINKSSISKSDTTKVIELAIRTSFYHGNLPEISHLKKPFYFKDSILFTADTLLLSYLPDAVDTLNFKVLSQQQILSLILVQNDLHEIPNYLYIRAFEKSDTGYYVGIQSLSMTQYGGGGAIGIYINKEKDSFFVKKTMSSSIN